MSEINLESAIPDSTFFHREEMDRYLSAEGYGTAYFRYELRKDPTQVNERWQWQEGEVAVQVTDLGISVRAGFNRALVWVNRLSNGEAVAGAEVTVFNLRGTRYQGITDKNGPCGIALFFTFRWKKYSGNGEKETSGR